MHAGGMHVKTGPFRPVRLPKEDSTTGLPVGIYVYYTRDEDGRDSVPRVAIRMQEGTVAEVRGVNAAQ